jgi:EpsI family protein
VRWQRTALVVLLIVGAGVVVRTRPSATAAGEVNLEALPHAIAAWQGVEAEPPDAETRRILAADAVLTRTYRGPDAIPVGLYIAYYATQRPGVSIHSPLHCLPGTGWEALEVSTLQLSNIDRGTGTVRRMIVRKQRDRALVLYWYSVHGRTIANEVVSKLTLMADSVRLHRSDAALVRIVVPIGNSVDAAERTAIAFARDLLPYAAQLGS